MCLNVYEALSCLLCAFTWLCSMEFVFCMHQNSFCSFYAFSWTLSLLNMPYVMHQISFLPIICLLLASHSVEFAFSIHQSSLFSPDSPSVDHLLCCLHLLNASKLLLAPFRSLLGFVFCKICLLYVLKLFPALIYGSIWSALFCILHNIGLTFAEKGL